MVVNFINTIVKRITSVKPGRGFYVFLICLAIASAFWLLNALSREYSINIEVPLNYTGIDEDMMIVNDPPRIVRFSVTGEGYSLLPGLRRGRFDTVEIDLSAYPEKVREFGLVEKSFSTMEIEQSVSKKTGNMISPEGALLDSIHVVMEEKLKKRAEVVPDVEVNIKKQFSLRSEPKTRPDSVTVEGPQSLIDDLTQVKTQRLLYDELEDDVREKIKLSLPEGPLRVVPSTVDLIIEVERLTEGKITVPVKVKNLPDSLSLSTYPKNIEVQFATGLSKFDNVSPARFKAAVDYREAKAGTSKLFVKVEAGADIRVIDYTPEQVEYLIKTR